VCRLAQHRIQGLRVGEVIKAKQAYRVVVGRTFLAEEFLDNQWLITFYLKEAGDEVRLEESGRAAVGAARQGIEGGATSLAILMDMPLMDGYEKAPLHRTK
jgi:CheY-like chemotaxis protein